MQAQTKVLGGLSLTNRGVLCVCPFILSPGVLRITLSHICCKLNLPIFLLSVGLLTLNRVLRSSHPQGQIQQGRTLGHKGVEKDKSRIMLTGDMGVAMVVMDRQEYVYKSNNLINQPAYRPIPRDPTSKIKAKHITILTKLKMSKRKQL